MSVHHVYRRWDFLSVKFPLSQCLRLASLSRRVDEPPATQVEVNIKNNGTDCPSGLANIAKLPRTSIATTSTTKSNAVLSGEV